MAQKIDSNTDYIEFEKIISNAFSVGIWHGNEARGFYQIWDYALTNKEIEQLYNVDIKET